MLDVINNIRDMKIIAIARGYSPKDIVKLAQAVFEGGINMIEVTFDQSKPDTWLETAEAITSLNEEFDGRMLIGAGTVMTKIQLSLAARAGARYIISPNTDERIIAQTKELSLVSIPGAMTPTECAFAKKSGADFVKVFPAANLGASYIKAIMSPLSDIEFLAVGGITVNNAADFIMAGAVGIGAGGSLVDKKLVMAGELDKITEVAREYAKAVRI